MIERIDQLFLLNQRKKRVKQARDLYLKQSTSIRSVINDRIVNGTPSL